MNTSGLHRIINGIVGIIRCTPGDATPAIAPHCMCDSELAISLMRSAEIFFSALAAGERSSAERLVFRLSSYIASTLFHPSRPRPVWLVLLHKSDRRCQKVEIPVARRKFCPFCFTLLKNLVSVSRPRRKKSLRLCRKISRKNQVFCFYFVSF